MSKVKITMQGGEDFKFKFTCVADYEAWTQVLLYLTQHMDNERGAFPATLTRDNHGRYVSPLAPKPNAPLSNLEGRDE